MQPEFFAPGVRLQNLLEFAALTECCLVAFRYGMALELSELYALQARTIDPVKVGMLPDAVMAGISAKLPQVYVSQTSLLHILAKHDQISLLDLLCLPFLISDALWISELKKSTQACASYVHPESGKRYKAAIKSAASGYEVYPMTLHLTKPRQTQAMMRRGSVLQYHR